MRFTVNLHDLHAMIEETILFTGKDSTKPALHTIRWERQGDNLLAVATDRHRLVVSRIAADYLGTPPAWTVGIDKRQYQILKAAAKSATTAVKGPAGNGATVEFDVDESVMVANLPAYAATVNVTDASECPDWRAIFRTFEFSVTGVPATVNPSTMGDFRRVWRTSADKLLIETSDAPNKPIRLTMGSHFCGLLMGVKPDGQDTYAALHKDLGICR